MTQPGSSQRSSPRILRPDRREQVEAAVSAVAVGARQTDRMDAGAWWAHVWDVEPIVVAKVHYVLPRRRCICCRKLITAAPPFGQVGTVAYGPEHQRRGDPLASEGNVPIEATAQLMPALRTLRTCCARMRSRSMWSTTSSPTANPPTASRSDHRADPGYAAGLVPGDRRRDRMQDRAAGRVHRLVRRPGPRRLRRLVPVRRAAGPPTESAGSTIRYDSGVDRCRAWSLASRSWAVCWVAGESGISSSARRWVRACRVRVRPSGLLRVAWRCMARW